MGVRRRDLRNIRAHFQERQIMSDAHEFWSDENREIDDLDQDLDCDLDCDLDRDLDRENDDQDLAGPDADDRSIDLDLDPDPYPDIDFDFDFDNSY